MTKSSKKTYRELKEALSEVLAWFEAGDVDIDEAIKKHTEAKKLLEALEEYLTQTEQKITKIL